MKKIDQRKEEFQGNNFFELSLLLNLSYSNIRKDKQD
jgi:hypothetical protein